MDSSRGRSNPVSTNHRDESYSVADYEIRGPAPGNRAARFAIGPLDVYSRPAATFFMPASSFLISSGDSCGRSMLIVSLLSSAVSGNGGR